jgi:hypothetical protein
MKNPRLPRASGLAPPPAGVGRRSQENPHLGPRTGLARYPREVGPAAPAPTAAPAAGPAAATPAPLAPSGAAPRSSPGCETATTPASASDARPGTPPTSRPAGAPLPAGQAGTTDDRSGMGASAASLQRRARHDLAAPRAPTDTGASAASRRLAPVILGWTTSRKQARQRLRGGPFLVSATGLGSSGGWTISREQRRVNSRKR